MCPIPTKFLVMEYANSKTVLKKDIFKRANLLIIPDIAFTVYLNDPDAPIPHAFDVIGWHWAKWIVSIGGIFGLCASLFGAMFPLPRIIYAMANDALVFRFLGTINQRFRTPVIGTIFAAILTGLMSALFNLKQLVNMMSIGTLMAYTIVAACVIILRYTVNDEKMSEWKYSLLQHSDNEDEYSDFGQTYETTEEYSENLNLIPPRPNATTGAILKMMFDFSSRNPDYLTQKLVTILVFIFCVLSLILACLVSYLQTDLENGELYAVIPTIITALFMLVVIMAIWAQPTVHATLSFKVPLVPLIPALSICINLYLMLMLDGNTWIRFGIWMAIGLPIYLTSCKLYSNIKTNTIKSNGHINNGYVPDNTQNGTKNGIVLTIPQIIVSTAITDEKNEVNFESETDEKYLRERTLSIDSEDFTNAVLEIDKVLYESENEFVDNFEAVNPENELKNTKILTKSAKQSDNISISSSNSGSNDSKEHHIEVQVHQEDSDEADNDKILPNLELDKNFIPETTEENSITKDSKQTTVHENKDAKNDEIHIVQSDDETEDHITNNNKTIENAAKHNNSVISEDTETNPEDNGSLVKESLKTSTPEHNLEKEDIVTEDGIIQVINLTTEALQQNSKSDNTSVQETNEDMNKNHIETNVAIPPPPPLQDLLNDSPYNIKLSINRPVLNIKEVQLRPTSVPIRTRSKSTSSTKSEGPSDNVKTGSTQYNKLKSKLNSIFQDRIILPTANIKYLDERTPSPSVEKELEINNQILEQYEVPDIPENFGKSKEFKNELNNLLLRRHSSNLKTKPKQEYIEKQNKNNDNSSRTDETKHRKLMASSLKSIRLKKTGILDTEETDQENYDDEEIKEDKESETTDKEKRQNMTEKDKETHKRLMIATLRNIKLRKTGLNLNEESADPNDISLDR